MPRPVTAGGSSEISVLVTTNSGTSGAAAKYFGTPIAATTSAASRATPVATTMVPATYNVAALAITVGASSRSTDARVANGSHAVFRPPLTTRTTPPSESATVYSPSALSDTYF